MGELEAQKQQSDSVAPILIALVAASLAGGLFVLTAAERTRSAMDLALPNLGRLGGVIFGDRMSAGAVVGLMADVLGFVVFPMAACCVTRQPTLKPSLLVSVVFYGWFVLGGYLQVDGFNVFAALLMAPFYIGLSMLFCLPIFLSRRLIALKKPAAINPQSDEEGASWPPPPDIK